MDKTKNLLLVFDIGNTTIFFGVYHGDELLSSRTILDTKAKEGDYLLNEVSSLLSPLFEAGYSVEIALISSVVKNLTALLENVLGKLEIPFRTISPSSDLGIEIHIDNPEEVGVDLLCDCLGAKALFGGNVFIADMGTASKYILCGEHGDFEGCAIDAGLGMTVMALFGGTDALPEVNLSIPKEALGKNTVDSINSALTYAKADAIEGMAKRYETINGTPLKRVLTGGYGALLVSLLADFEYVPALGLIGLKEAYGRLK